MGAGRSLVEVARRYLGTPFRHQGRQPGLGLDCAGVIVCAARQCGLGTYDRYGCPPQEGAMREHLLAAGLRPIGLAEMAEGDVLLMRFIREAQHLALATDKGILHAHQQVGRVVEHRLDEGWRRRIIETYRFPEFL